MKTYYVRVPREKRIYFTVEAEDSRDARFEAIKHLVFNVMHGSVPLDVIEGDEVYQCEGCADYFNKVDLNFIEEKMYCHMCDSILIKGIPDPWK